jgi:hypothetical protein
MIGAFRAAPAASQGIPPFEVRWSGSHSRYALSNGDLTASGSNANNWTNAAVTTRGAYPGEKVSIDMTLDALGSSNFIAGIVTAGYAGVNPSPGYFSNNGGGLYGLFINGAGGWSAGHVLTFDFDVDAGTLAVYRNNGLVTTISSVASGIYEFGFQNYDSSVTATVTLSNTYSPRTGFDKLIPT